MISALISGVVLGVSAGASPGPLLALVISQTLQYGPREGMKVALAPLLTDLPIILVSLLILSRFSEVNWVLALLSLVGGGYVLYLAYESIRAGAVALDEAPAAPQSIRRGGLVNALSPHPYLFWITVGGPLMVGWRAENPAAPAFFILGFYVFLVGTKIGVALVVGRSRRFLSGRLYRYIIRGLGVMLAVFGVLLIRGAILAVV